MGNPKREIALFLTNKLQSIKSCSVAEDIRLFKTAPQAYELLLKAFPVKKEEVLFVSSNAWDALAAKWFGFDVFWVNRLGHPFEEIGERPDYEGASLSKVLEVLPG